MSDPIALLSSAAILRDDLADFILKIKGHLTFDEMLFGRFSNGGCHIWVGLSPEELTAALEDNGADWLLKVNEKLDAPPRTYMTIEISRTQGSEILALDFAILFSERWPAIIDDLNGRLLSRDELLQLRANGRSIRSH